VPLDSSLVPEAAASALGEFLAERYGAPVEQARPPQALGEGFDCQVYSVHLNGVALPREWATPIVLRIPPLVSRFPLLGRETRLQEWCAAAGYPAPRPLGLFAPGEVLDLPVQVLEEVPGVSLMKSMMASPWRVPDLVGRLARLHVALHRLPVPGWADANDPQWSLVERRLALVRHVVAELAVPEITSGLRAVEQLCPQLAVDEPTVCQGDFHPLNVLIDGRREYVLDWTDSGLGDRHGDIARTALLFRLASVAAPRAAARIPLRSVVTGLASAYLRAYRQLMPVDTHRLQLWRPVHLLHLWSQAVADEHELFGPSQSGVRYRHGLSVVLQKMFDDALPVL
jgi:aminoglycoside phosphotransferase (APT) family kinase protein